MHWEINPNLPKDLKEDRRRTLYYYGIFSCVSSFIILAAISVFGLFLRQDIPPPTRTKQPGGYSSSAVRGYINACWLKSGKFVRGQQPRLGSRRLWIGIGIGVLWMGWLSVVQTKEDYFHLTKRFGRISAALFPLQYLLSTKAILQLLVRITGASHERLNVIHRWLGRLIIGFLILHGVFYGYYFAFYKPSRALRFDVFVGIIMTAIMLAMAVTGMPGYRSKNYRTFYLIHLCGACALLGLAWLHVDHVRPYVLASVAIFGADKCLRLMRAADANARVECITKDLIEIHLAVSSTSAAHRFALANPGMHAYLCVPSISKWRFHPFTVSGVSADGRQVRIVARKMDGFTRQLYRDAGGDRSREIGVKIDGPYGASDMFPKLDAFDKVVLVAGGVGATFAWPIWVSLFKNSVDALSDDQGDMDNPEAGLTSTPRSKKWRKGDVRFIWSVKSIEDIKWASRSVDGIVYDEYIYADNDIDEAGTVAADDSIHRDNLRLLEVFVTGHHGTSMGDEIEMGDSATESGTRSEIALELASRDIELDVQPGRPNVTRIIQTAIAASKRGGSVAILVCGPPEMGYDVKKVVDSELEHKSDAANNVWFWCEEFGW